MGTSFLKKIWRFLDLHSTSILTGVGIAGMVTAIPVAIKCKQKADRLYIQLQTEKTAAGEDPKLTKGEKIKIFGKSYWLVGTIVAISAGCIILSDVKMHGKVNGLKALLVASQDMNENLKAALKEQMEEKEAKSTIDHAEQKYIEQTLEKHKDQPIEISKGGGTQLCCDMWSGRFFYGDAESIRRAFNDLNEQRLNDCFSQATYNDLYFYLGIEPNEIGGEFGWDTAFEESPNGSPTSNVIPDFISGMLEDGTTYLGFRPSISPEAIG